jgi:2,4-dienoyl-CoA reductase-like NADH-dependent reductase (Old Yellow Enzyme family)
MAVTSPAVTETQIHIDDDRYIPGLEKIITSAHQTDKTCKIIAQVAHVDNITSPSGINWTGKPTQGIYTIDQIKGIINSFSEAILRAKIAGFDGVELNAHYTYFLSSFLSAQTNKREDEYGGSLENRVRIVKEIVQLARNNVGNDFPIIIKMNCDDSLSLNARSEIGTNIDNFPLLANEIEKAGFDAIEISGNTMIRKDILTKEKESYFADYASNLNLSIPVILTGGNRSLDTIEDIFSRGKIDFFGLARPLIREPDLVNRWKEKGNEVKSNCISCNSCLSASGPLRCMQLS